MLIKAGADVNAMEIEAIERKVPPESRRAIALIYAAENGHTEIAKLLIEAGTDVNAQSHEGYTALMLASGKSHTEIVKLLIEAGVEVNVQNKFGETALILAEDYLYEMDYRYESNEIIDLLREAGAK